MASWEFDEVDGTSVLSETLVDEETEILWGLSHLLITPKPVGLLQDTRWALSADPDLYFNLKPFLT